MHVCVISGVSFCSFCIYFVRNIDVTCKMVGVPCDGGTELCLCALCGCYMSLTAPNITFRRHT
jgi:hypothetical protein